MDARGTAQLSDDPACDQDDQFSQSLEMLDGGCPSDSAVDAEDIPSMLAQHYAYVFPSDSMLATLAGIGPLVEMGAGTGYWAHRLRSIGADIVAFDQAPVDSERTNRYHPRTRPWTHVEPGDQTVLSGYADRGLFLCWPPLFSSLGDCLTYYSGDTIALIGDGGYRTARLDHLHEAFTRVVTAPVRALDPYPGVRPQLTIWKRTRLGVFTRPDSPEQCPHPAAPRTRRSPHGPAAAPADPANPRNSPPIRRRPLHFHDRGA